jgi:hypothetical protein
MPSRIPLKEAKGEEIWSEDLIFLSTIVEELLINCKNSCKVLLKSSEYEFVFTEG